MKVGTCCPQLVLNPPTISNRGPQTSLQVKGKKDHRNKDENTEQKAATALLKKIDKVRGCPFLHNLA